MLKKTISYEDYNGIARKEDFYFNLSKAELMDMELGTTGGYVEMLKKLIAAKDVPELIKIFKSLITSSYGVKSPDGKRFIKSEELTREFTQTEAYTNLYMELVTDTDAASEFVNGIIPKELNVAPEDARKLLEETGSVIPMKN